MATEIRSVQGLSELLRAMEQLPREIASKNGGILRRALFAAAKVIRDEARITAPKRTGLLSQHVIAYRDRNPGASDMPHFGMAAGGERYLIGVRRIKKKYGENRENRRKRRAGQSYTRDGSAFYWRFLEFGTAKMAAKPFMRPAFEARKYEALSVFKAALERGVRLAVKKVAKLRSLPR